MDWKVATFNVNGIRARISIVLDWLQARQPDVCCLQEIKCQDKDFPISSFEDLGYFSNVRGQKAYNGVAFLSRKEPEAVSREFDDGESEEEARFIAGKFQEIWVINTYVPQGRSPEDPAFQSKLHFFTRLKQFFQERFHSGQKLVWTGDMNVAPEAIDVFDPEKLAGEVGFHPEEHKAFKDTASWGLIDLFRRLHNDEKQFTFWDYRLPRSFQRNLGWRLDHIMVTESMFKSCKGCHVDSEFRGLPKPSDHAPVWAEFDL